MRHLVLAIGLLGCEHAPEDRSPPPGPMPVTLDATQAPVDASTVQPIDPMDLLYPLIDPPKLRLIRVQQHGTKLEVRFEAATQADGTRFFKTLAKVPSFTNVMPMSGERIGDTWDYTAELTMPRADPKASLDWFSGGGM